MKRETVESDAASKSVIRNGIRFIKRCKIFILEFPGFIFSVIILLADDIFSDAFNEETNGRTGCQKAEPKRFAGDAG